MTAGFHLTFDILTVNEPLATLGENFKPFLNLLEVEVDKGHETVVRLSPSKTKHAKILSLKKSLEKVFL